MRVFSPLRPVMAERTAIATGSQAAANRSAMTNDPNGEPHAARLSYRKIAAELAAQGRATSHRG
jgi:hypothetical protein